jgi:hypothetical protein
MEIGTDWPMPDMNIPPYFSTNKTFLDKRNSVFCNVLRTPLDDLLSTLSLAITRIKLEDRNAFQIIYVISQLYYGDFERELCNITYLLLQQNIENNKEILQNNFLLHEKWIDMSPILPHNYKYFIINITKLDDITMKFDFLITDDIEETRRPYLEIFERISCIIPTYYPNQLFSRTVRSLKSVFPTHYVDHSNGTSHMRRVSLGIPYTCVSVLNPLTLITKVGEDVLVLLKNFPNYTLRHYLAIKEMGFSPFQFQIIILINNEMMSEVLNPSLKYYRSVGELFGIDWDNGKDLSHNEIVLDWYKNKLRKIV